MRLFSKRYRIWLAVIMLLTFLVMVLTTLTDSPTYDEPAHIAAGVSYVEFNDLRLNPEHPPLIKFLSGLSIKIFYPQLKINFDMNDLQEPLKNHPYILGNKLFADNDSSKLLLVARLPSMLITLLAIYFIFLLVHDLTHGDFYSLIASTLFAFELSVLSNGALVTTDMGMFSFWLGCTYFYLRFLFYEKTRWYKSKNLLFAGIFFGLALLTKYSAAFILPILFLASLSLLKKVSFNKILLGLTVMTLVGWISIWIFYLPFGSASFIWEELAEVQQALAQAKSVKLNDLINVLPLPSYYQYGLKLINYHEAVGQLQFLAGKTSQFNWWWFYPLSFLLKTSVIYLSLLTISIYLVFKERFSDQKLNFFLLIILLYFLLVTNSSMAFGMRILLPVIGFGTIVIASGLRWIKNKQIISMMMIFYILLSLVRFPYFFSSVNLFTAVVASKHELLIDSNLDWGQDLKRLSNWCREKNIGEISIFAHSSVPIEIYGIKNITFAEAVEQKGFAAVSSTYMNLPIDAETEEGEIVQVEKPFTFLDDYVIAEKLGSLIIFDLSRLKSLD